MYEKYDNKIMADNLKYYMDLHRETYEGIAEYLGISKSNMTAYLKGTQVPRMNKVDALCQRWNITRTDLMAERPETPDAELLGLIQSLTPDERNTAIGFIKGIIAVRKQK